MSGHETGNKITIKVNGKAVETEEGKILLPILRELGVHVPTLCYDESVSSAGACRLCVVEAKRGNWSKVVVSCLYPVWDGLEVETDNERVRAVRKLVLELLLARCPGVPIVQKLARAYGIESPRYPLENHRCILCGLCVRVCEEVVGVSAIAMLSRGAEKTVGTPYMGGESTCIGCAACVYICPTQCIEVEDRDGKRILWHEDGQGPESVREFTLRYCKECGRMIGPDAQLDYFQRKYGLPEDFYDVCTACRSLESSAVGS